MANPDGYVLIYRRLLDHPAFRSPAEAMAFAYLVAKAAWRPTRVRYRRRAVVLERGQLTISVRDFAAAMERPLAWAQRFLERLETDKMIARKPIQSRYSRDTVADTVSPIISICNYDAFQMGKQSSDTVTETLPDTLPDTQNNKEKEIIKRITTPKSPSKITLPEWVPAEAWEGWLEMRKAKHVPATERSQVLALNKLTQFRKEGHDPGKILDMATMNGWTGLYPGKNGETQLRQPLTL